jgi:hypothetical protein
VAHYFEFDFRNRILLVVLEGEVESKEITSVNDDIRKHVESFSPLGGISDFTEVKSFKVPSHAMRAAALEPSPYPEETPRFIVAPTDYLFGMARMYELIANRPGGKLRVVRSRQEALAALGVKEPRFERVG